MFGGLRCGFWFLYVMFWFYEFMFSLFWFVMLGLELVAVLPDFEFVVLICALVLSIVVCCFWYLVSGFVVL